jgi:hypothetical protein
VLYQLSYSGGETILGPVAVAGENGKIRPKPQVVGT